jgi:hypothetical protein
MPPAEGTSGAPAPGGSHAPAWLAAALCAAVIFWMGLDWDLVTSRGTYTGRKGD